MDIAFLIDGSGSIEKSDFSQMKTFVKALMGLFSSNNTLVRTGLGGLWKGVTDVGRRSHTTGGGGSPGKRSWHGYEPRASHVSPNPRGSPMAYNMYPDVPCCLKTLKELRVTIHA